MKGNQQTAGNKRKRNDEVDVYAFFPIAIVFVFFLFAFKLSSQPFPIQEITRMAL
jgi:hypothetical protein